MRMICLLALLVGCGTSRPQVAPDAAPDSLPDALVDPCTRCTPDQLCVQRFDGICNLDTECIPRAATCQTPSLTETSCSQACNAAYCPSPYQCMTRLGCSGPPPSAKAFTCYGP
jgi:hypothetical protein